MRAVATLLTGLALAAPLFSLMVRDRHWVPRPRGVWPPKPVGGSSS